MEIGKAVGMLKESYVQYLVKIEATSGRGGGCTPFVHGRSRMTTDPRIPTMPGRSMSVFHEPGSTGGGG